MKEILHKVWPGANAGTWIDNAAGEEIVSYNPADGSELGRVRLAGAEEYDAVIERAAHAFERWRMLPAPKRGEIVREIGDELRARQRRAGHAGHARNGQDSRRRARAKCRR